MQTPLITVIVPCFNGSAFLKPCVESILRQDCDDEIIIIDDGSTDDSLARARELALAHPDRIMLIAQANRGPAAARNAGIRAAAGKYLGFLDVDDEYATGFLKRATDVLTGHDGMVAVEGRIELVDLHRPVEPWQREAMESTMLGTVVVRTEIARLIGGFPIDPAFRGQVGGEDACFRQQLPRFGDIAKIDHPALRYRLRRGSHADFFLDRAVLKDGRVTLTRTSAEEADGRFAAALRHYKDGVAAGMVARVADLLQTEMAAGVIFDTCQRHFGDIPGPITPAEGFALHSLAKRWPLRGYAVEVGGIGGLSTCWLTAGCRAGRCGKLAAVEPVPMSQTASTQAPAPPTADDFAVAATSAELGRTLMRLGLTDASDLTHGGALDLASRWGDPVRLLCIVCTPSNDYPRRFQAWSPHLAGHGLLILHGVPAADAAYRHFCAQVQQDGRRWKPMATIQGLAIFENLGPPKE